MSDSICFMLSELSASLEAMSLHYMKQKYLFHRWHEVHINMFHVFALAYLTTGFYGLRYYFAAVLRATSAGVYLNESVYNVSLRMCSVSTFVFKFIKIIYRYTKRSGTWNMFPFAVVWQEFISPLYECFFFYLCHSFFGWYFDNNS